MSEATYKAKYQAYVKRLKKQYPNEKAYIPYETWKQLFKDGFAS